MPPELRLRLLGTPQIIFDETPLENLAAKTQALLFYLAATRQPQTRSALATLLWGDMPEKNARSNLRKALQQLRIALPNHLVIEQQLVSLRGDTWTWVDLVLFEEQLNQELSSAKIQQREAALALYQGDFLTGFHTRGAPDFELWQMGYRANLREKMLNSLQHLSKLQVAANEDVRAIETIRRIVDLEPWRESAHQQLMKLLAQNGQRGAALAQYELCIRHMAEELDVEPGITTAALAEAIRNGEFETDNQTKKSDSNGVVPNGIQVIDLLEMPHIEFVLGRDSELFQLQRWVLDDACRLCTILGVGGVGKTTLASRFVSLLNKQYGEQGDPSKEFKKIFWRSLLNAPPLTDILRQSILFLSDQKSVELPQGIDEQFRLLIRLLQQHRSLLVLDNFESIIGASQRAGTFRAGYEAYGQLIQRVAQSEHQSCLLLTSREKPQGYSRLERDSKRVRSLQLAGLSHQAAEEILAQQGLRRDEIQSAALIERYSGHPLALKLVAETIDELYFGDISAFLSEETLIFADIKELLDQHFARLSPLELEILTWLAISRVPIALDQLGESLLGPLNQRDLLEALRGLQRRSLLEKHNPRFSLQNVIMEYTTERLIDRLSREIIEDNLETFNRYPLIQTRAADHIRQSQHRIILQPVIASLLSDLRQSTLIRKIKSFPDKLRVEMPRGYATGNILNTLHGLGASYSGSNFSDLAVWQADLQRLDLQDINFSGSHLRDALFTDAFGYITAVNISDDSETIAFGTADGEIRISQRRDGQIMRSWRGHGARINTVGFSPCGSILVSSGNDHIVNLWNISDNKHLGELTGHRRQVTSAHFSPDGNLLVTSSRDCTMRLWILENFDGATTEKIKCIVLSGAAPITAVRFSPDGQMIACGMTDQAIHLWDVKSAQILRKLPGPAGERGYSQIRFSPDGKVLASIFSAGTCVWDVGSGNIICELHGGDGSDSTIDIEPNGKSIYCADFNGVIRKWDLTTGELLNTWQAHNRHVSAIAISYDGEILVSGGWDRSIRLWHLPTHNLLQTWRGYSNRIWSVSFDPAGQLLASGSERGVVNLWDINTGQVLQSMSEHSDWVMSVCFSPVGKLLAGGGGDMAICLWDISKYPQHTKLKQSVEYVAGQARYLVFSPNGSTLVCARGNNTVHVYGVNELSNGSNYQNYRTAVGHESAVWAVDVSPCGDLIASASRDQTVRIWDMRGQDNVTCLLVLRGHESAVGSVSFSPTAPILASGSGDKTIRLWDINEPTNSANEQRMCRILEGHSDWVNSVCFSPNGQFLASGGADHKVCLWDPTTGQRILVLEGHTDRIWSVCFSPNSQLLASGSADGTIRLWKIPSGECQMILRPDRPYERTNIAGVTGISEAQKATLKALGAVDLD